jgi:hypothetical protein
MKTYLRLAISFVFTWVQLCLAAPFAMAASSADVQQMRDFFVQAGLTKKNVRLADYYAKTKSALPADLKFEIELYLELNPNALLPKLDLKTVKNGSSEDLQISFTEKGQSGNMLFSLKKNELGRLTYSLKGKTYDKPLKYKDVLYPVRFLTELSGPGFAKSEKVGFAQFLNQKQVAAFKLEDRNRYQNHIRELLNAAEKVQMKHKKLTSNGRKEKKTSQLLEKILTGDLAWAESGAKDAKACLTMGWVGNYKSGICEPPAAAKWMGCYVCNPAIYGKSFCGKTSVEAGPDESSTGACNKKLTEIEKKPEQGKIATAEDIKKFMAENEAKQFELTKQVNLLLLLCQENGIQDKECADLRARVQELRRDNCRFIEDNPQMAEGLRCYFDPDDKIQAAELKKKQDDEKAAQEAAAAKEKQGTISGSGKGTDGAPSKEAVVTTGGGSEQPPANERNQGPRGGGYEQNNSACAGLPTDPSGLGCSQNEVREKKCNEGGTLTTYYFCKCQNGRGVSENSTENVRCESGYVASTEGKPSRYTPRTRPAPAQKSWWEQGTSSSFLGPMLGLLGFVGMAWLSNYQMKQQLAQQYQMLTPQTLQIAPPPVAPVLPAYSPVGVPVIQSR